jgi:hypothetical protein
MTKIDTSNYYQCDPKTTKGLSDVRFPRNHVKFFPLLKIIDLIEGAYRLFGSQAFMTKKAMVKEFNSAAPLDQCLGTAEELKQNLDVMVSFCDGVDNNPFLSAVGRFLVRKIALDSLKNRKKVLKHYHDNKDFIEKNGKYKKPVIITGAPRSGTTLLQRLMSEDPNTRSPYTYEMEESIPPMTADADPMADPRIKSSSAAMSALSKLAPGFMEKFAESHLWSATEMEESIIYMFWHNGIAYMNQATAGFAYTEDLFSLEGKRTSLAYERLFFNMLDAYRPAKSHWTLKSPCYAPFFPIIFDVNPDANVVLTHRNPMISMPSLCRIIESWCIAFDKDGSFDKHRFAQTQSIYEKHCLMRPLHYRKEHPESENQIFDCMYEDFFKDPIAVVKKIYQKFDLEYTDEFEKKMRTYLENNRQGKYGRHKYSLEEYGFEAKSLAEDFKEYMEHFKYDIPEKAEKKAAFDFGLK